MNKQKKIEPVVGEELIHKVKALGNLSKEEKAKLCGYYSVTRNGLERVNMMQFLNALIDAEGIKLDATDRNDEHEEHSASSQISVRSNGSTDSNKIVTVKRINKVMAPQLLSQPVEQPKEQELKIEQPEPPKPVVYLDSLAEPPRDESVYDSGWSLTELMNEFRGR